MVLPLTDRESWKRLRLGGIFATIAAIALTFAIGSSAGSSARRAAGPNVVHPGYLTFGADLNFPPFEYMKGGTQEGFDVAIGKALAHQMHLKARFLSLGFQSLIPSLDAKKFDVVLSGLFVTKARAKVIRYVPYATIGHVIVTKKNSSYQPSVPKDLCGHKVPVQQGGTNEALVSPGGAVYVQCKKGDTPSVRSFPEVTQELIEVAAGRSDALIEAAPVAHYELTTQSVYNGLHISSPPGKLYFPFSLGMAVTKTNATLQAALTQALRGIEKSGQYAKLLRQYDVAAVRPALVKSVLGG